MVAISRHAAHEPTFQRAELAATMKPNRLYCPACSSRGVKPSTQWRPFDLLYRIFGRTPHNCLWCGKRSYLVSAGNSEELREELAREIESKPAPPVVRHEPFLNVAPKYTEKVHLHQEKNGENHPRPAMVVIEPESWPAPAATLPLPLEIAVPEAPAMYAENGRLRLSGITLEQIQRRDPRIRRPGLAPKQ